MKKSLKITLLLLCGIVAVLLAAVLVFVGIYFTRIQTMNSIEKLSDYDDGYNLYRMEVKYDYSLDDVINYGIKDNQTMIDAILKDALPLLPVKIEAPSFGCTAFTLTDADGDVHMGRNYDFKNNNVSANAPDESTKMKLASLTAPYICLDGLNEKGVSIAVLTLDSDPVHQSTGKPAIATTLAIRLVLDRAASTEEAVELLRGYDMFASSGRDYHFYITDATGDGRVVEYDCESETRELVALPINAITNFYGIYKDKVLPNQKNGIYGHGRERYDAVLEVFDQQKDSPSNDTVWAALKAASQEPNPESITSNTQWSIAYNNTDLTAEIIIRRHWEDMTRYGLTAGAAK